MRQCAVAGEVRREMRRWLPWGLWWVVLVSVAMWCVWATLDRIERNREAIRSLAARVEALEGR